MKSRRRDETLALAEIRRQPPAPEQPGMDEGRKRDGRVSGKQHGEFGVFSFFLIGVH